MIRNIVFDVGNVLLNYQPMDFLHSKYDNAVSCELFRLIFESEEWAFLDKGSITNDQAVVAFVEKSPNLREQIENVTATWIYHMTPKQRSIELLYTLKQRGYALYYLSNFQKKPSSIVLERYDFWDLFTGGIFSCDVKLMKPERAIYESLLRQYGLQAGECVFLDDTPACVEGAVTVGMQSILFRDTDAVIEKLEVMLE